jgi:transcriptional regulator with XRE-family HTH domain
MDLSYPGRGLSQGRVPTQQEQGPTVRRVMLGTQLRRLREASGISREAAGYAIRASHAKISRLELGRVGFKERDVVDLLTLYGVTNEQEREAFLALARRANTPGWWHHYGDVLPSWFETYLGLEQASSVIRTYAIQFVPDLLQTADYARAAVELRHLAESVEEIARRVAFRMARQNFLMQPGAPELWAVLDETALRRSLGDPKVMRAQVQHLIDLAALPNVTLQVVPFILGGYASTGSPFTILRFSEPDLPDVVYLEQLTTALYLDKKHETDKYLLVMDNLGVSAESPDNTILFLNQILKEC